MSLHPRIHLGAISGKTRRGPSTGANLGGGTSLSNHKKTGVSTPHPVSARSYAHRSNLTFFSWSINETQTPMSLC